MNTKFYECYAEGQSHFYATQQEADASIASLRELGGDYADVEFSEIFREADLDEIAMGNVAWDDTSESTKAEMVALLATPTYNVLTAQEIADQYSLSASTVTRAAEAGAFPSARKAGRIWLINRDEAADRWNILTLQYKEGDDQPEVIAAIKAWAARHGVTIRKVEAIPHNTEDEQQPIEFDDRMDYEQEKSKRHLIVWYSAELKNPSEEARVEFRAIRKAQRQSFAAKNAADAEKYNKLADETGW